MKPEVETRLRSLKQRSEAIEEATAPSVATSPTTDIVAGIAGRLASNAVDSMGLGQIIPRRSASAAARKAIRRGNAQAIQKQRAAWRLAHLQSVNQLLTEVEAVFRTLSVPSRTLASAGNSTLLVRKLAKIRSLKSPTAEARALAKMLDEVIALEPMPNEEVPLYLAQRTVSSANAAAEIVSRVEIALRSCVQRRLAQSGDSWWTNRIPPDVRRRADNRRRRDEDVYPRVAAREGPLSYLNFSDYDDIILDERNWSEYFSSVFESKGWISTKLGDLEEIRNALMHSNPLTQHGLDKLRVTSSDLIEGLGKS